MSLEILQTLWFLLVGVLLAGYAVLDGFDLGVGVLHLFGRNDEERRISMNAIGPVWDGNEVWLLTGGGALFAAFPLVYARVFSGFYLALMLLLFALIFRAVSLEFRGKVESPKWRRGWDFAFGIGSLVPALLLGVALGNVLRGLPVAEDTTLNVAFLSLLNPYALVFGALGLAAFVMHGAAYLAVKTEGDLQERMARCVTPAWIATVVLYLVTMVSTFFAAPFLFEGATGKPLFWLFLILVLGSVAYVPVAAKAGKHLHTLLSTGTTIASTVGLLAVCLFPRMVPSSIDLAHSLTINNASSSQRTLLIMLVVALIGVPIMLAYTSFIYWVFRGKVELTEDSY